VTGPGARGARSTIARLVLPAVILAATLGTPEAAAGQEAKPSRVVRIGRLSPLSADADAPNLAAFRQGMRERGWVEGKTFTIEGRFATGQSARLPELARDLVRQRVDLILVGSNPGALAARGATDTIPIVMITTGDPVAVGLVKSLARPGGNVTGLTALGQQLDAKRLELIKEAVPGVTRVGLLANPNSLYTPGLLTRKDAAARVLGLELPVVEAPAPDHLERAFAALAAARVGAVMVQTDAMFITHRRRIVELAGRSRLPAVYGEREFVEAGGLMFYGASFAELYREIAGYADRILKGTRPADLPVEQPTKLELIINLRTARALGLTIPSSVMGRADRLLE
jgi:putative tryptophan/tyrosine transport system substrate-binding protein